MARPLRIEFPGAVYHVTSRGNARADIYSCDQDRELFLSTLAHVVKRFKWLCHAYCLMGNHYHLLIETPEGNLSAGMRQLNGVYTQAYNRAHGQVGHLFQGRYKAILVEKESHLLQLCRYVVLNPVRAGMVPQPELYRWSSYLPTLGLQPVPKFLTTAWLLGNFASSLSQARERYQKFVADGMQAEGSPWDSLTGQILLGTDNFNEQVKSCLEGTADESEFSRIQRHAGRPNLDMIFSSQGPLSKIERNRLIRLACEEHGYTLKEVAGVLGLHYTTVSKVVGGVKKL